MSVWPACEGRERLSERTLGARGGRALSLERTNGVSRRVAIAAKCVAEGVRKAVSSLNETPSPPSGRYAASKLAAGEIVKIVFVEETRIRLESKLSVDKRKSIFKYGDRKENS